MKVKTNLWRLHNVAEAYGKRPSEILGLKTSLGAWQFDETCLVISRHIQRAINENKRPFDDNKKQGYAPMPKRGMKRMKIPENGIW